MEQAKQIREVARHYWMGIAAAIALFISVPSLIISVQNTEHIATTSQRVANEANDRSKENQTTFCGSAIAIGELPTDLAQATTPAGLANQQKLVTIIEANKKEAQSLHCTSTTTTTEKQ